MLPSSSPPPGDSLPEPQSSKSIAIPSKHTLSSSAATTRCGCRCGGCTCSLRTCCNPGHSFADSNREAYGGQGTNIGAASNNVSNLNATSLEAQVPQNMRGAAPPSLEILSRQNEYTSKQLAESRTEQYLDDVDDDAPWLHYLSQPSMTSDAPELSGMFFGAPEDMEDGSMENNPASRGSGSMLSYMSGLTSRGEAAGAVVQHAGAALTTNSGNQRNLYLQVL